MNSKTIAFVVTMVALGNVLSFVPIGLSRVGQVGFDLSLVATFVVAFYGGPFLGLLTGFAGGIAAGVQFGPLGWLSWLGLIGLPVGKALTGFTSGTLFKGFGIGRKSHSSLLTISAVLLGYIPEFLFTVLFFLVLVPSVLGWLDFPLLVSIAIKAWIEMAVMSVLMGALIGNEGFNSFLRNFFQRQEPQSKFKTLD